MDVRWAATWSFLSGLTTGFNSRLGVTFLRLGPSAAQIRDSDARVCRCQWVAKVDADAGSWRLAGYGSRIGLLCGQFELFRVWIVALSSSLANCLSHTMTTWKHCRREVRASINFWFDNSDFPCVSCWRGCSTRLLHIKFQLVCRPLCLCYWGTAPCCRFMIDIDLHWASNKFLWGSTPWWDTSAW